MTNTERWPGRIALMVAHCAGMVDLVALPVWVGTLITSYKFDAQEAGGLVSLFLLGAVASSLYVAHRFGRIHGRTAASAGFAVAALAFLGISQTSDYASMAALHALAGSAAGCGLSVTHGTIGRSANPHRLFALVGMALGVFAIVFLGVTSKLVAAMGGAMLFRVFAAVMLIGALVASVAFPAPNQAADLPDRGLPLAAPVWFAIAGISSMALVQAMTFSFVERIGIERGFGLDAVTGVLIALGFVNLIPAPLAALLERRWSANTVVLVGPIAQAALALVITHALSFVPYAAASALFVAVMIFTHTFAFGLLARLDPTGRALAATPAMLMVGAAIGPVLGGTFVQALGYGSIGLAALVIAALALTSFSRARPRPAEA